MKKKIIGILSLLLSASMLTGCGKVLQDDNNANYSKENVDMVNSDGEAYTVTYNNRNKIAEVYYDINPAMIGIAADETAQSVIKDSVDAITKTWNDVETSVYSVGEGDEPKEESSGVLNDIASINYSGTNTDTVRQALEYAPNKSGDKVLDPRIKLIITDLASQLSGYQDIAKEIDADVMKKNKSMSVFSVKTETPIFIFAVGALNDLSEYIDKFYASDEVVNLNGTMDWTTIDMERTVNCKLYPQSAGISGIDYDNIKTIEQGEYLAGGGDIPGAPPAGAPGEQGPGGAGAPGMPPAGMPQGNQGAGGRGNEEDSPFKVDKGGSFTMLRSDYTKDMLKESVEGTVNFAPEDGDEERSVQVVLPEDVSQDVNDDDVQYLAYKSLLGKGSDELDAIKDIAGKIKITVPFSSMSQIQLTDLNFELNTTYYDATASDKKFYDSTKKIKENVEVAYASNEGPQETQWRIDNQNRTAMFNIYVNDLKKLEYATKLDLQFTASTQSKTPVWVQEWSKMSQFKNLKSFIDLLDDYNMKDNKFEDKLTVYLISDDKDEPAEVQPLSEVY